MNHNVEVQVLHSKVEVRNNIKYFIRTLRCNMDVPEHVVADYISSFGWHNIEVTKTSSGYYRVECYE